MENATSAPLIVLKELAGNHLPQSSAMQQYLAAHIQALTAFWFAVWCTTVVIVIVVAFLEYRRRREP